MIPNYSALHDLGDSSQMREQALVASPVTKCSMEAVLSRSILTAHLLLGDITEAEKVVMEAIDIWELDGDDEEQLFQITLRAAVDRRLALFSTGSIENGASDYKLPIELRRVLELPAELRRPFVLQVLIGLPSQVCAQLLEVDVSEIPEYCWAAMKRLSALDR